MASAGTAVNLPIEASAWVVPTTGRPTQLFYRYMAQLLALARTAGVSEVIAGVGLSVDAQTGEVTISNVGILAVGAGQGIGVTTEAGEAVISNTGVTELTAGDGIAVSGATGNVTVSTTGASGGPFTTISSITVADGIVTAISGS